jgi:alkanesulfonate monooxygenase SsuD/methylene tetrahydromethanopterin reductase-like flavin-dependent oxidoreductase (luciferase family)
MRIGIGLPSVVPDVGRAAILAWARAAEDAQFDSLGIVDRLAYDNLDPLVSLAAAGAVTERIGLLTCVLLSPLHRSAILHKQVSTLVRLAGAGRVALGLGIGARPDDYAAAGVDFADRGAILEAQLPVLRSVEPGATILLGGASERAIRRAARLADGWIAGGGGADAFAPIARRVHAAWNDNDRAMPPRLAAISYISLGPDGLADAERVLGAYYAFAGPLARRIVEGALTSVDQLHRALETYHAAHCDEVVLVPCSASLGQLELIATAVAGIVGHNGAEGPS